MSIAKYACLSLCLGLGLSFAASAGDRDGSVSSVSKSARVADAEAGSETDSQKEGFQQTLNINFSPERREMLRKALEEYARAVDPSHDQIEERRRAMQDSIETRFFEADSNGDSTLDRQEATEKLPQIARHFSNVDTNQDGVISLTELVDAQARILERRRAAEAALELQKQRKLLEMEEVIEPVKPKSKQATNTSKKKS